MKREDEGECNVGEKECEIGLVESLVREQVVSYFRLSCGSDDDGEEDDERQEVVLDRFRRSEGCERAQRGRPSMGRHPASGRGGSRSSKSGSELRLRADSWVLPELDPVL
jgi:hypothetical protein